MERIYNVEQASLALQCVGGLPVAIRAEYVLRDDGKLIAIATTKKEFATAIAIAIQLSPAGTCFISSVART